MNRTLIIQARTTSTRLPGKVLLPLLGQPMLAHQIERLKRCRLLDQIVVATTTNASDDPLVELARRAQVLWFRGDESDVLDRFYRAAVEHGAAVVVRVTADCPLIDPGLTGRVVGEFLDRQPALDYASNVYPRRTYPRGLDTEVCRFDALECAWREARDRAAREHVTPYIYRHPERFRLHGVTGTEDYSHWRWTVDTPEDFELVRRIYEQFGHNRFAWQDVLPVLAAHPDWGDINRCIQQQAIP